MGDRTDESLISRNASSALKGLLILLVIMGHNSFITGGADGFSDKNMLFHWLYSFHVYCFMILPFLYDSKPITGRRIWKDFVKLYIPYIWVFIFCGIVFAVLNNSTGSAGNYFNAFIMGNEPLLKSAIGFNFPWFLPAMFALLILKGIYDYVGKWLKIGLFAISIAIWIVIVLGITTRYEIGNYVPLAISQAFLFLPMGLAVRWIRSAKFNIQGWIWWLLFALLSSGYLLLLDLGLPNLTYILRLIIPVVAFMALYNISDWLGRSRFIRLMGNYSLPIYLIHIFVFNALSILAMKLDINNTTLAITTYILTIGITLVIALFIKRWRWLNRVLFPTLS